MTVQPLQQVAAGEDQRLGAHLASATPPRSASRGSREQARVRVVGAARAASRSAGTPAARTRPLKQRRDELHRLRAEAALGEERGAFSCDQRLSPPVSSSTRCDRLSGYRSAYSRATWPPNEWPSTAHRSNPSLCAQGVGVGGQVLPGHRRDGRAHRTSVAAVVVEDERELVGEPSERMPASSGRPRGRRA